MRHPTLKSATRDDVFTDLLFNALLGFVFMFAVAFLMISDPKQQGDIESKAEMLITVRWPDNHPDDIDAVIEDPAGVLIWYYNPDSGLIHLDRDDRGVFADQVDVGGARYVNPINQETLTLRRIAPGEYVVNLLHYKAHYQESLPVTVKVERLNPEVSIVYYGEHAMAGAGHELTAVRFTLAADGSITDINQMQKSLLTRAQVNRK